MSGVSRFCKHEGLAIVTKYNNNKQIMLVCQEVTIVHKTIFSVKKLHSRKYTVMEAIFQLGIYSIKLKNSQKHFLLPGDTSVSIHGMGFQTTF